MTIYLIGPSGVGKTSCARRASEVLGAQHIALDSLCRGNEFNWPVCCLALARLESQTDTRDALRIVDIGAGTQTLPELRDYLLKRRQQVVLIWAPESEVVFRNPCGPSRPLEEYRQTEYTSREDLYALALHRIKVEGMTEPQANEVFISFLSRMFIPPPL